MSSLIAEKMLLCDKLIGFRSSHSSVSVLIDVSENVRPELDNNKIDF